MKLTLNPDPYNPKGPAPKFGQPVNVFATRRKRRMAYPCKQPKGASPGTDRNIVGGVRQRAPTCVTGERSPANGK
jgi:hypothetical protein